MSNLTLNVFLISLTYTDVYQIRIKKNFIKCSKVWTQKTLGAQRAEKPAGPMAPCDACPAGNSPEGGLQERALSPCLSNARMVASIPNKDKKSE